MDIKNEELQEKIQELKPIPWPEFEGIAYPTFLPFRFKGVEQHLKDIQNLQCRKTDVLICTHSKAGTHWIFEIISMLYINTTKLDEKAKAQTMLEAIPDLSIMDGLPSPRILDTHVQFPYIPKMLLEAGGKIVHMTRNPKDVCVSLYHHAKKDPFISLDVPWNEFFDAFTAGKVPYGSWYDYELGMERAEIDHPKLIYTCFYEDMKKNPEKEIKKLAEFLGTEVSDELVKGIAKATSFDNMQKNKFDSSKIIDTKGGKGFIYRKGEIGDWKNYFTVAQSEEFDTQYKEKMKSSTYKYTFE